VGSAIGPYHEPYAITHGRTNSYRSIDSKHDAIVVHGRKSTALGAGPVENRDSCGQRTTLRGRWILADQYANSAAVIDYDKAFRPDLS
jgi:hypothetical protein